MKNIFYSTLIAICLILSPAQAKDVSFSLHGEYQTGGDDIATVEYRGHYDSTLRVNEGMSFGAGIAIPLFGGLELQSTFGFQTANETAKNGEISWRSLPWETSLIAHLSHFLIGGGVIYHVSPKLKSEGDFSTIRNIDFDNSLGYQAQMAYLIETSVGKGLALGVKYTRIDFEKNQIELNGDSTGFFAKFYF
jgi:hypothetical protein